MMPSAKIVICDRFFPENMSYSPNIVFFAWSTSAASASGLIPGVGMWPPTRYTASSPSVNSTRFLRSATAKMFLRLSIPSPLREDFGFAARGRDLFGRLAAELVRTHRQRLRDVAARQHLDLAGAADDPLLPQQLGGDFRAPVEPLGECIEVHDLEFLAEQVVESALRDAPVERHLPTLEPALLLPARARLRALVTAARLRALAGAVAAADPLLRMRRALGRTEI